MSIGGTLSRVSLVLVGVLGLAGVASADLALISSFNPEEGGGLNSIGFDPSADRVYVHFSGSSLVHIYDRAGNFQSSINKATGVNGNDDDLDFADEPVNLNGTIVPANTLLITENDNDPPRIVANVNGVNTAQATFDGGTIGQLTGGSWSHARNTFFVSDFAADVVRELDAANQTILNSFTINPVGATPGFDFFFSDLDVLRSDGNLYLVSDRQNTIRVLTPDGDFVTDLDVGALGLSGMSGIAFDDVRGEAWISSTNGTVYQLGGFDAIPTPSTFATAGVLLAGLAARRRR